MSELKVDLSKYENWLGRKNKIGRAAWILVNLILFKPFFLSIFNPWRLFLLRCFGAKLHPKAHVYSSVKIWAPWNLIMKEYACLAPDVDCYNVAVISIGAHTTISQKAYLCSASHNITLKSNPLIFEPIIIEDQAWVGADAYIGMGVTIGQGAVVGARACVFKDVKPWTIVGGNPAKFLKDRVFND
ncbi:DapH/DapD/GlmU-related protein [Psychroserpens sp. AS72]|uniref:DapH/DapD/GlmU-related protein n=1 Tax=Psychroserpens sp. AS72 TaxID=3135775 RepID=UPI003175BC07